MWRRQLTERSVDTDYVDANKIGSHDPLCMTETVDSKITITDYVLAYVIRHIHLRPREQMKTVVLSHFTKCEILAAKHALLEASKSSTEWTQHPGVLKTRTLTTYHIDSVGESVCCENSLLCDVKLTGHSAAVQIISR